MQVIIPTHDEIKLLHGIKSRQHFLHQDTDSEFLTALLHRSKPLKVLEIGVAYGGSSIVILNAIQSIPGAKLYSVDLNNSINGKKVGFLLGDHLKLVKDRHVLYTGGMVHEFIDEIGDEIDFCFIDTAHRLPGEFLDFLAVYPYLIDKCPVVLHDIQLHSRDCDDQYGCTNLLLSALQGEKLAPKDVLGNIGGVKVDKRGISEVWGSLLSLSLRWKYHPSTTQWESLLCHLERFYDQYSIQYLRQISDLDLKRAEQTECIEKTIDSLGPIYLFGAGQIGKKFCSLCRKLSLPIKIQGILDNNPDLWGGEYLGIPILPPEYPKKNNEAPHIIISHSNLNTKLKIDEQCSLLGYKSIWYKIVMRKYITPYLQAQVSSLP